MDTHGQPDGYTIAPSVPHVHKYGATRRHGKTKIKASKGGLTNLRKSSGRHPAAKHHIAGLLRHSDRNGYQSERRIQHHGPSIRAIGETDHIRSTRLKSRNRQHHRHQHHQQHLHQRNKHTDVELARHLTRSVCVSFMLGVVLIIVPVLICFLYYNQFSELEAYGIFSMENEPHFHCTPLLTPPPPPHTLPMYIFGYLVKHKSNCQICICI